MEIYIDKKSNNITKNSPFEKEKKHLQTLAYQIYDFWGGRISLFHKKIFLTAYLTQKYLKSPS